MTELDPGRAIRDPADSTTLPVSTERLEGRLTINETERRLEARDWPPRRHDDPRHRSSIGSLVTGSVDPLSQVSMFKINCQLGPPCKTDVNLNAFSW